MKGIKNVFPNIGVMNAEGVIVTHNNRYLWNTSLEHQNIIVVLEQIALQTRLLSLNASIEAARAHEHDKAFSAVAAETRQLSDTTRKAAEEINKLANTSLHVSPKAGETLLTLLPSKCSAHIVFESCHPFGVEVNNGLYREASELIK